MALVKKQNLTLQHPTEPETTVVVRVPLQAGDLKGLRANGTEVTVTFDLLAAVIQSWSYDEPVTVESMEALDLDTFAWLSKEIMERSGVRGAAEKKASASGSSDTSAQAAESSPPNSGI